MTSVPAFKRRTKKTAKSMRSQSTSSPGPARRSAAGAADGVATPPAARSSAPRDNTPERIGTE
eukprot:6282477-Prymnesium_polylepis.1